MTLRIVSLCCIAALLAGCAGGAGSSTMLPSAASAGARGGELSLRVRVPRHARSAHYVSPATKGLSVDITGPTNVKQAVGLDVSAKGCVSSLMTLTCTLDVPGLTACPSTHNCYTATVATYDKFDSATNKIPPGARKLSADVNVGFTIATGSTLVPLVLQGIPKKVALIPASDTDLAGSQNGGFTYPKCAHGSQKVSLFGVDADGNYILGPGAPELSLTSDNTTQMRVLKPAAAQPNAFELLQPKSPGYAYGNFLVHLTAKATPATTSGAAAASSTVDVTYSGDICGNFKEFSIPTSSSVPYGIITGPDGNLWFTEEGGNKVGKITTTGTIAEFTVPTGSSGPEGIAAGPDGNLWFVENSASKVGKMTTAGITVEYPTVTAASGPNEIVLGPDGNLWFGEAGTNNIARITPTGVGTEFPLTTASSGIYGIATGPDGNIWFTESSANKVGFSTPTGSINDYTIPTAASRPTDLVAGQDGDMWFAECHASAIGRVSTGLTTGGNFVSNYVLPDLSSTLPAFDTQGPDGAIWFSEAGVNKIGRVTAGGTFTEFAIPTSNATPFHLTTGPDGAIWFVEALGNKVARLR